MVSRTLRLFVLCGLAAWPVAARCQDAPMPAPGPAILVAPQPAPQPVILKADVPENVVSASERGGIVQLFPWDVTASSIAGSLKSPVALPLQPTYQPHRGHWGTVRLETPPSGGSITIWTSPPAAQPHHDHLNETIRKALTGPQPPR